MTPTWSQKGNRRYRYYLCTKAHRHGWDTCPSKSIPAIEIEKFVVDKVRAIGRAPELVARTVDEARRQMADRKADLEAEYEAVEMYRNSVAECEALRDYPSRDLFAEVLRNEDEHVDFLETQFEMINQMGLPNYIQLQSESAEG